MATTSEDVSPSSPSSSKSFTSSSSSKNIPSLQKKWHPFILCYIILSLPVTCYGKLPPFDDLDIVDENNLTEGQPKPLDYSDFVDILGRLQQEDDLRETEKALLEARSDQSQEDPRFIGITDGGRYRGDLVVYLPITILLPTFAFRSRYSMAGKKSSDWSSFLFGQGRSHDSDENNIVDIRGPVDKVLTDSVQYDPDFYEYTSDQNFGPLLSRIDAYFHYLKVQDDGCRLRTICHLAQNPQKYSPLSYLILSALKKSESFERPTSYNRHVFRFMKYYWAAERGAANNNCSHAYYLCPADLEDIVNMRVLNFWQNLASYVSIKLSDE